MQYFELRTSIVIHKPLSQTYTMIQRYTLSHTLLSSSQTAYWSSGITKVWKQRSCDLNPCHWYSERSDFIVACKEQESVIGSIKLYTRGVFNAVVSSVNVISRLQCRNE